MDTANLQQLISLLQAAGVAYYKDATVELVFNPAVPKQIASLESGPTEKALPDIFKKLPANYSHPALLGMIKFGE